MLRIGELAAATGFTPKTLRYYEDVGLIRPDRRSESGYRLYGEAAVGRLRFVHLAQGVGLRLEDIRQILEISDGGRPPCDHVMAIVDRDLDGISEQLERLHELRDGLLALRSRMTASGPKNGRAGEVCPCFRDDATE